MMRAVLVVGVRRGARASDDNGETYAVVQRHTIAAPPDWQEKQLATAVSVRDVEHALDGLAGLKGDFDTVEFTVEFEEAA